MKRFMKLTVLTVLLMISMSSLLLAGARRPQRLADMIDRVEVIAVVKIQSVDFPRLHFEVIEVVAGEMAKGKHKTDYYLPPYIYGGRSFHIAIPGSGLETSLVAGEKYIFLFERKDSLEMIRAEMPSELETIKQTWENHKVNKAHPPKPQSLGLTGRVIRTVRN